MKDSNRRDYEACKRDVKWSVDYTALIPVGSMLETKFAALSAMIAAIEAKASAQAFAIGETGEEFDQKDDARRLLRKLVASVSDAAVAAVDNSSGAM